MTDKSERDKPCPTCGVFYKYSDIYDRHLPCPKPRPHPPITGRGYTPGCPCSDCREREPVKPASEVEALRQGLNDALKLMENYDYRALVGNEIADKMDTVYVRLVALARPPVKPIVDQPPPKPSNRRPAWELVIEFAESTKPTDAERNLNFFAGTREVYELLIADMHERDKLGRERYGQPLQADNGRNHLVDAWQELLDAVVYLMADLDERGVSPTSDDPTAQLFIKLMGELPRLRARLL